MAYVINPIGGGGQGGGLEPTIRAYAPSGSSVTCDGQTKVVGAGGYVDFVVSAEARSILPSGVQGVRYIESHGKEVIKTNVDMTNGVTLEYDVKYPAGNGYIYGVVTDSTRYCMYYGWGRGLTSETTREIAFSAAEAPTNAWHHVKDTNTSVTVDSVTKTRSAFDFSLGKLWIFKRNDSTSYSSNIQLGVFIIDGDSNAVLIPCYFNSQYGMWDVVSNSFFGNQGTGAFTGGETCEYLDYPTYTVTATLDGKTATEEVKVDEIGLFEVELEPGKLYLYKYGDECTDVTGGWSKYYPSSTSGTILKTTDYMQATGAGGSNGDTGLATVNKVDMTGYSSIHINIKSMTASTNDIWFMITDTRNNGSGWPSRWIGNTFSNVGEHIYEIPSGTTLKYVLWTAQFGNTAAIDKVWLE